MRRTWSMLTLLVAVWVPSWSVDDTAPSRATLELRGPVKECETAVTSFELRSGVWQPKASPGQITRWTFDAAGRCITLARYSPGIQEKTAYTYAPSGGLSARESTLYDWQGRVSSIVSARYDDQGAKTEEAAKDTKGALLSRWSRRAEASAVVVEYRQYDEGALQLTEDTVYDRSGRITKREKRLDGRGPDRWAYTYDAAGKLQRATFSAAGTAGVETWGYVYDAAGRPTAIRHVRADGSSRSERAYRYDLSGNVSEETATLFSQSGAMTATVRYAYDGKGRVATETYSYAPQSFAAAWSYEYDAANRVLEQARTDTAGRPFEAWRYAYDTAGATVLNVHGVKGFETGQRTENVYDASGRLTASTTYNLAGQITTQTAREYDENGFLVEDRVLNADGSLRTAWSYVYTYDRSGNWVSMLKLYTDNLREEYRTRREETRRTLAYY